MCLELRAFLAFPSYVSAQAKRALLKHNDCCFRRRRGGDNWNKRSDSGQFLFGVCSERCSESLGLEPENVIYSA